MPVGDFGAEFPCAFFEQLLGPRLLQKQRVAVASVQHGEVEPPRQPGEMPARHGSALGEKPVGDAAQLEDLDAARMQRERARLPVPRLLSFEDPDPHSGQRQFGPEQQPSRARPADHDIGVHNRLHYFPNDVHLSLPSVS